MVKVVRLVPYKDVKSLGFSCERCVMYRQHNCQLPRPYKFRCGVGPYQSMAHAAADSRTSERIRFLEVRR